MYCISTDSFKNIIELCHVEMKHLANSTFDLTDKISFLINNHLLQQKKFEKVNIAFLNNEFTLVPEAYALEKELKPFLKFTTGTQEIKKPLRHHLKNLDFSFNLDTDLVNYLEKAFPNASIRHSGAVTIDLLFSQQSLLNNDLYLNLGDGFIELAAKEKNDLLLYNVFSYESNDDILYYLLFMMEQFNLNPLYVKLAIAGERPLTDELIKSIKKYVKRVSFCIADGSLKLNGDMTSFPRHYYFTLLNQHLCEL